MTKPSDLKMTIQISSNVDTAKKKVNTMKYTICKVTQEYFEKD